MAYRPYQGFGGMGTGFGGGMPGMPTLGLVTRRLLIWNIGVFFVHMLLFPQRGPDDPVLNWFGLSRSGMQHLMIWQLVTYQFLHGNLLHLFGNMLGLFFFGRELEARFGARRFLMLYLGGGVLGGLGWLILSGPVGVCIGASGAVFAVLGAFAALYPYRQITLLLFFVIPVTMSARTMALLFGGISLLMLRQDGSGVAHAAHLAGGIAGWIYGYRNGGPRWGRSRSHGFGWHGAMRGLRDGWARWRRMRIHIVQEQDDPEAPVDWERIDQILVKIRARGIGSLTASERAALDRASRAKERQR